MIDWRFTSALALLTGTVVLSGMAERRPAQSLARPLETISTQIGPWRMTGRETLGAEVLDLLKPTSYLSRFYEGNELLGLFIAFYERQTAGATLHSPKNCLPGSGWEVWKQAYLTVPTRQGSVTVNRYSIRRLDEKIVMYYWYQSKDHLVASEIAGKFLLVRDALFSGHTAAALVRVTLPDTAAADEDASGFIAQLLPQVQDCFGK
jgi:EpsI family protein